MNVKQRTVISECDRCNLAEVHHQEKRSWNSDYYWEKLLCPDGWEPVEVPTHYGISKSVLLCPRCLRKFKETGE